jgi:hypothetical protein
MALDNRNSSDRPAETGDGGGPPKRPGREHLPGLLANLLRPAEAKPGMTRRQRWLTFGSNVILMIILATAITVGVVWVSGVALRGKMRADWTATGRFSLSPQSKAIVQNLQQDLTIAMVYADPDQYVYESREDYQKAKEEYERMADLLQEFAMASGRVKVERLDPLNVPEADRFLAEIQKRFTEQLKAKDELLKEFGQFRNDLDAFIAQEVEKISAFGTAQPPPAARLSEALTVAANELVKMSKKVQMKLLSQTIGANIKTADEEPTLPEARNLTSMVAQRFKQFAAFYKRILETVSEPGQPVVPDPVKQFLQTAAARFDPLAKRADELQQKIEKLPKQKFDEIKDSISTRRQCLVLESGDDVQVVPVDDAWVRNPRGRGDDEEQKGIFFGERVVSSAILGMAEKKKPALLFITSGMPATMMGGPYGAMAERLRKAGLLVEDWDVLRQQEMPKPENASKIILVFVPPPQPDMRQPMPPPTPEQYRAAIDAVKGGAPAIILGEASSMFAPPPPYTELFELFGVELKASAVAVHSVVVDAQGTEEAVPQVEITTYADHPITRPLGALPTMFLTAAPLTIKKELPAGVTAVALAVLPTSRDYWADTSTMEAMQNRAKRDEASDIIPTKADPVPLGVAATRKIAEGEQRAVLFGDADLAQNRVAFYRRPFDAYDLFPGNAELFANSALWTAGLERLISISPESLQARRIGDVGAAELPLRLLIIVGLPVAVLIVGIIVYVVRRR